MRQSQRIVNDAVATLEEQATEANQVHHFQAGVYQGGPGTAFAEMGDIPSNSAVFRDILD